MFQVRRVAPRLCRIHPVVSCGTFWRVRAGCVAVGVRLTVANIFTLRGIFRVEPAEPGVCCIRQSKYE